MNRLDKLLLINSEAKNDIWNIEKMFNLFQYFYCVRRSASIQFINNKDKRFPIFNNFSSKINKGVFIFDKIHTLRNVRDYITFFIINIVVQIMLIYIFNIFLIASSVMALEIYWCIFPFNNRKGHLL